MAWDDGGFGGGFSDTSGIDDVLHDQQEDDQRRSQQSVDDWMQGVGGFIGGIGELLQPQQPPEPTPQDLQMVQQAVSGLQAYGNAFPEIQRQEAAAPAQAQAAAGGFIPEAPSAGPDLTGLPNWITGGLPSSVLANQQIGEGTIQRQQQEAAERVADANPQNAAFLGWGVTPWGMALNTLAGPVFSEAAKQVGAGETVQNIAGLVGNIAGPAGLERGLGALRGGVEEAGGLGNLGRQLATDESGAARYTGGLSADDLAAYQKEMLTAQGYSPDEIAAFGQSMGREPMPQPGPEAARTAYGEGLERTADPGQATRDARLAAAQANQAERDFARTGEAERAGTVTMYHGNAGPIEGGQLREGAFLTPNPEDAQVFANIEAKLNGGEPTIHEVQVQPGSLIPAEEGLAGSRGAMQVAKPEGVRLTEAGQEPLALPAPRNWNEYPSAMGANEGEPSWLNRPDYDAQNQRAFNYNEVPPSHVTGPPDVITAEPSLAEQYEKGGGFSPPLGRNPEPGPFGRSMEVEPGAKSTQMTAEDAADWVINGGKAPTPMIEEAGRNLRDQGWTENGPNMWQSPSNTFFRMDEDGRLQRVASNGAPLEVGKYPNGVRPLDGKVAPHGVNPSAWQQAVSVVTLPNRILLAGGHFLRIGVGEAVTNPSKAYEALKGAALAIVNPEGKKALIRELDAKPYVRGDGPAGYRIADFQPRSGEYIKPTYVDRLVNSTPIVGPILKRTTDSAFTYLRILRDGIYEARAEAVAKHLPNAGPEFYRNIYNVLSDATGHGFRGSAPSVARAAGIGPSALAGRFRSLVDVVTGGGSGLQGGAPIPFVTYGGRAEALRNLIGIAGVIGAADIAGNLAGAKLYLPNGLGGNTNLLNPYGDVESKLFKVGTYAPGGERTTYGPDAGYSSLLRLLANAALDIESGDKKGLQDHTLNWARAQSGPTLSLGIDLLTGHDWEGNPYGPRGGEKGMEALKQDEHHAFVGRWAPIASQAMWDAYQAWGPEGIARAAPSLGAFEVSTTKPTASFDKRLERIQKENPATTGRDLRNIQDRLEPYFGKFDDYYKSTNETAKYVAQIAEATHARQNFTSEKAYNGAIGAAIGKAQNEYLAAHPDLLEWLSAHPDIVTALKSGGYAVPHSR